METATGLDRSLAQSTDWVRASPLSLLASPASSESDLVDGAVDSLWPVSALEVCGWALERLVEAAWERIRSAGQARQDVRRTSVRLESSQVHAYLARHTTRLRVRLDRSVVRRWLARAPLLGLAAPTAVGEVKLVETLSTSDEVKLVETLSTSDFEDGTLPEPVAGAEPPEPEVEIITLDGVDDTSNDSVVSLSLSPVPEIGRMVEVIDVDPDTQPAVEVPQPADSALDLTGARPGLVSPGASSSDEMVVIGVQTDHVYQAPPAEIKSVSHKCGFCGKIFPYRSLYESHLVTEELSGSIVQDPDLVQCIDGRLTCLFCPKSFLSVINMANHICNFHGLLKALLEPALQKKHGLQTPSNRTCRICGMRVPETASFVYHISQHFLPEFDEMAGFRSPFQCSTCGRQFNSRPGLIEHLAQDHQIALKLYYRTIQYPRRPTNVSVVKAGDGECFVCLMCKNKVGTDQDALFKTDRELRSHLFRFHFQAAVCMEVKSLVESSLKCPEVHCGKIEARVENVRDHFLQSHCPVHTDQAKGRARFEARRWRHCLECDFVADNEKALVIHWAESHKSIVETILVRMQLGAMLRPQPVMSKKQAAIKNAINYHHPGRAPLAVGLGPPKPVTPDPCIEPIVPQPATVGMKRPLAKNSLLALSSDTKRAKVEEGNAPTLTNALRLFRPKKKKIENPGQCNLCETTFERLGDNQIRREYAKHLYREHFRKEVDESPLVQGSTCPICKFQSQPRSLKVHYFVEHGKIWDFLKAKLSHLRESEMNGTTTPVPVRVEDKEKHPLSVTYADDNALVFIKSVGNVNNFDVLLSQRSLLPPIPLVLKTVTLIGKLPSVPSANGIAQVEMNLKPDELIRIQEIRTEMRKLSQMRHQGRPILQNHACYQIGNVTPYCHECSRTVNQDTICQFEGFRRILFKDGCFRSAGFRNPFTTPTDEDKAIWIPQKAPNQIGMDLESAKFIVEYCGSEFIKMADEEREVVEEYRRDKSKMSPQSKEPLIWKPMQAKVREMCDVCSTSLFNVHWTCTDCCTLICIDCFKVRRRGGMEYKSTALARPYKNRPTLGHSRDSHMWPYCHEQRPHRPQDLQLTQVICGNIFEELKGKVMAVRKALWDAPSGTAEHDLVGQPALLVVADLEEERKGPTPHSVTPTPGPEKSGSGKSPKYAHPKNIVHYPRCPLCGTPFANHAPLDIYIHFRSHCTADILRDLPSPSEPPYPCNQCDLTYQDQSLLVLHLGMAHEAFDARIRAEVIRTTSTKNITLKVDSQPTCICNMSYLTHQMGMPEIRTHLMTHFRKDISLLVPDPDHYGNYCCPDCPVVSCDKSKLINHLGIFHGYLDQSWDKAVNGPVKTESGEKAPKITPKQPGVCKILASSPTVSAPTIKHESKESCTSEVIKKTPRRFNPADYVIRKSGKDNKENVSSKRIQEEPAARKPPTPRVDPKPAPKLSHGNKTTCSVCDERLDDRVFALHTLTHYQDQLLFQYLPTTKAVFDCEICSKRLNPEKIVRHYGLTHNKVLDFTRGRLRSSPKWIVRNKEIIRKAICPVCHHPVSSSLTNHLSTHLWLSVHIIRNECVQSGKCSICAKALTGNHMDHLLTLHFDEILSDFWMMDEPKCHYKYAKDSSLSKNLRARLITIFTHKFCVLCEVDLKRDENMREHHVQHFFSELQRKSPYCEVCPSFKSPLSLQTHFADCHYETHVQRVLEAADRFTVISLLREKLNIKIDPKPAHFSSSPPGSCHSTPTPKKSPVEEPPALTECEQIAKFLEDTKPIEEEKSNETVKRKRSSRAASTKSSRASDKWHNPDDKELCEFCPQGYKDSDYYIHMALGHFKGAFEVLVPSSAPFQCPRCVFLGDSQDEIILHFAEYHQMLDYVLKVTENPTTGESVTMAESPKHTSPSFDISGLVKIVPLSSETNFFSCAVCSMTSKSQSKIRLHVVDHIRDMAANVLPKKEPFICPLCLHESSTKERLWTHFAQGHRLNEDAVTNYFKSMRPARKRPWVMKSNCEEIQELNVTGFHLKLIHDQRVSSSPTAPYSPPKKHFSSLIASLIGADLEESPVLPAPSEKDVDQMLTSLVDDTKRSILTSRLRSNVDLPSLTRLPHVCMKEESTVAFPGVRHDWLCEGRLLVLEDPKDPRNKTLFQEQWKRGQPVIIANSSNHLDPNLWSPSAFLRDFGHIRHSLINCLNGNVVPDAPLRNFWTGFEYVGKRLIMRDGRPMLLKLKDWPPTDDIAEYMPERFDDLINSFSMPEYTLRNGKLNLAAYLPDIYLKPELGPKMYIAYGSALYSDKGSTNLHIDMSDAVNCLVYVGLPKDGNDRDNMMEVFKEIDKAGCDILMKNRSRLVDRFPGALWHIFHPTDTPKIRAFLKQVAIEKGKRLNPHDDPIHDQSTYLDGQLRVRLYREYGVQGYAIVQCMGDTVFIPAGAAHQVRNLHNCIKVAEDFVSPENISHCLHLTQEFRHLTEWHTNHEDKLQIKSILYHAIKTALSVIQEENGRTTSISSPT